MPELLHDVEQGAEVRLLQALLEAFKDPDAHFANFWAKGVWLGSVDRKLPRAPAIYERKTKWPRDDPELALQPEWQTNYSSLREHELQQQVPGLQKKSNCLSGRMLAFLDNSSNYHKLKKGNQIQVLILCSIYVYFFHKV